MKRYKPFIRPALIILSVLLIAIIYYLYIRDLVIMAYVGNAPSWFDDLVHILYPRFEVEKQRFDLNFFLNKSDQIILRLCLIGILISLIYYLLKRSEKIQSRIESFWDSTTSVNNVVILRILFFAFMLFIFHDIYWDMMFLSKAQLFYKPIFILKIFHLPFPSEIIILIIYIIFLGACIACIFNFYSVLFSIIAITDFILIQGYIFSFEKTDHGFATFTYAGMLMPFLLYESNSAKKEGKNTQHGWSLTLITATICLCYLFTGLEKILISKLQWINPETFKAYLQLHQAPLGLQVSENNFLCFILPILTLIFQLGFTLVLFLKKLRWVFLPAGIIFHISTYFLFGVGGFFNPWILVYIFFIDWSPLLLFWRLVPFRKNLVAKKK